ncbi:MAG: Pyrrolo-quinoline quinone [Phycisphaerales bacterium]|nr:Pyrrolo-quinoline quinone [Phycisphaerales bacterium]
MEVVSVVPIFMSAGAAVLPTILVGLAQVGAVLLKPRELLRVCREKPLVPLIALMAVAVLGVSTWWFLRPAPAQAATHGDGLRPPGAPDWAEVASKIIHRGEWSYKPADSVVMFLSSPAVAGNRVYAAGCRVSAAGLIGVLACLDGSSNGAVIWEKTDAGDDLLRPFFSSPALTKDGKYLIVGEGLHEDRDCSLLCFDTATGELRWRARTPLHIESSPAIFGDMAVAGAGAIEDASHRATGDPGFVIAVRISDGTRLWQYAVNDPESSPAIDDQGIVYIGSGFNGNAVVALRSESDEELRAKNLNRVLWRTSIAFPATGAITLVGDLVIAGAGNSDYVNADPHPQGVVVALDRKTGQPRWQTKLDDAVLGAIAHYQDKLICPVRTGEVVALNIADGKMLWHTPISGHAPVLAGCVLDGPDVYAVSSDGYLARLDAATGRILGENRKINDPVNPGTGKTMSTPRVVGGRVFVGTETGGMRCLLGARPANE